MKQLLTEIRLLQLSQLYFLFKQEINFYRCFSRCVSLHIPCLIEHKIFVGYDWRVWNSIEITFHNWSTAIPLLRIVLLFMLKFSLFDSTKNWLFSLLGKTLSVSLFSYWYLLTYMRVFLFSFVIPFLEGEVSCTWIWHTLDRV